VFPRLRGTAVKSLMERTNSLLELLYDARGGLLPLGELAEKLRVDRAALDARIEQLRDRGHELQILPGGVRLVRPVRLDAHLIERGLGTRRVGRGVICFDEVDSTNDVAFDSAAQRDADGLAVLAEFQRRGRGRHGRAWVCPPRANIMLSVLLLDGGGLRHDALTIAAGLSVCEAIEQTCRLGSQLKWPNDVLIEGRKVAGVLVETRSHEAGRALVIGIGLNVNAAPPDEQVDQPATCIAEHVGSPVERIEIVRALLRRLDVWIERIENGELEDLHDRWVERCGMINERVTVLVAGQRFEGRVLDVSPMEGLVLFDDAGRDHRIPAAAATVVPTTDESHEQG